MKKLISVVLAVIMLVAVFPLHSFAFTVKLPTVEEVKFTESIGVSAKAIETQKKEIDLMIEKVTEMLEEELGELDYEIEDILEIAGFEGIEELYNYELIDDYGYAVEVKLSDGSVYEIELSDGYADIDRYTRVVVFAEVKYSDYLKAVEADEDIVDVTLTCSVVSDVSGISKDKEFTLEKDLTDCFIKSIKPVSTLNYTVYEDSDYIDLEGKKFKVTYADGSQKTYTAEKLTGEYGGYTMNGIEFFCVLDTLDEENPRVILEYLDAYYEHSVTVKESPYDSIEITDYECGEAEGLTSVTYKLIKTNSKSVSRTVDLTPYLDGELYPSWVIADIYDTYEICIDASEIYSNDNLLSGDVIGYELYVLMGYIESEAVELPYYESPQSQNILERIEDIIASILRVIFNFFSIFSSDEVIL